jgi:hypothetical protein
MITHMKRFKWLLESFLDQQNATGVVSKENPLLQMQFKDLVNAAVKLNDPRKIERLFHNAEKKLQSFFEIKKKQIRTVVHKQQFRTDDVAEQERMRD